MPNASYDTLTIKINADSKEATASLRSLSRSLTKLEDVAKNIDKKKVEQLQKILQDIASIDFTNVANGLQSVVSAFKSFQNKSFMKQTGGGNQLTGFIDEGIKTTNQELKELDITGIQTITSFTEEMEKASEVTKELGKGIEYVTSRSMDDFLADQFKEIGLNASQTNKVINALAQDFSSDTFSGEQLLEISLLLKEVGIEGERLAQIMDTLKNEDDEVSTTLSNMGFNGKQVADIMKAINYETNEFTGDDVERLEQALSSLGYSAEDTKDIISRLNAQTKKLDEHAKKTSTNGLKKLLHAFKNILKYRLIRKVIQSLYKALQEGFQNVAGFDTQLQDSLSKLTSAFSFLKNSIGALISPIIQIVEPVLTELMMLIGELANTFAEFFASVNGQNTFTKATYDLKKYNEQAKKTKSLGLDELNVLQQDNNGGFTTEQVNLGEKENELAETLRETFAKIGEAIQPIKDALKEFMTDVLPKIIELLKPILKIVGYILDLFGQLISETSGSVNEMTGNFFGMLTSIFSFIENLVKNLMPVLKVIVTAIGTIINVINKALSSVYELVGSILDLLSPILDLLHPIFEVVGAVLDIIVGVLGGALSGAIAVIQTIVKFITALFKTIVALFKGDFSELGNIWGDFGKSFIKIWVDVANFFIRILNHLISCAEGFVNFWIDIAGEVASWFGADTSGWGVNFNKVSEISYATGGFPEDGLFFANHNEMVGQFDNGKTAVANNEQIIEGIKRGVSEAMRESNNGNGNIIINLDGRQIAKVVTKKQNNFGADVSLGDNMVWGK